MNVNMGVHSNRLSDEKKMTVKAKLVQAKCAYLEFSDGDNEIAFFYEPERHDVAVQVEELLNKLFESAPSLG